MSGPGPVHISAVIPAHNPDPGRLRQTLLGLKGQKYEGNFEVILVNNASRIFPDSAFFAEFAPPGFAIVDEPKLGLTAARVAGFGAARGDVVILIDDDNVLAPDYFSEVDKIAREFPFIASWSGNVELVFEPDAVPPPQKWRSYLTERACISASWSNDNDHHSSTPWGAGMCVRSSLARAYIENCSKDPNRLRLDLSGTQLTYGGDTDIAYYGCKLGFGKGVFPQLSLKHLIPSSRCKEAYLLRAIEGHAFSELLHYWVLNGSLPPGADARKPLARRAARYLTSSRVDRLTDRAVAAGRARAIRELGGTR
ncbi:MAG TPA: glycosyltransferase family A protein [Opitutaceae bacterium]|jgi:hypothetical protein|nr:glycosyltransferase family A protein [Opitutaceae bacterium]